MSIKKEKLVMKARNMFEAVTLTTFPTPNSLPALLEEQDSDFRAAVSSGSKGSLVIRHFILK